MFYGPYLLKAMPKLM